MSAAFSLDWSLLARTFAVAAVCGLVATVAAYRWVTRPGAQQRRAEAMWRQQDHDVAADA
ncbi:MAG TPA: hypothetical protein VF109_09960 [Mycobacteriales bacterium]